MAGHADVNPFGVPPARLSREEALSVLEDRARASQHELASKTDAGDDILDFLAREGAAATRRAVAANLGAPPSANTRLSHDGDDDVRAELARKIARLMPDLPAAEQNHLRVSTINTLERLARDQAPHVRAILAEEIKLLTCVPKDIVLRLARDVEFIVAGPILEYSPLLSDADLMEIIATAKAEEALAAIARRRTVSAKVSDAIVSSLDIPAVAALLANPDARIRRATMARIVDEAQRVAHWQAPLALRADLSPRLIRRIATFVGSDLLERLVRRHGLDEATQAFIGKQMRQRLESHPEVWTDTAELAINEVEAARQTGRLNDRFVEDAAEAGRRETVIAALAALSEIPDDTVRRILGSGTAKPVAALVWRAGLSMRAAFKIQSFVMKLPASELLPARRGVGFPLTEDEMRWHLQYFGVGT